MKYALLSAAPREAKQRWHLPRSCTKKPDKSLAISASPWPF
jgi:hypothetical protein